MTIKFQTFPTVRFLWAIIPEQNLSPYLQCLNWITVLFSFLFSEPGTIPFFQVYNVFFLLLTDARLIEKSA